MFIACDYKFYVSSDVMIYPKFSNFLRIIEMFLIPFLIPFSIFQILIFIPKYISFVVRVYLDYDIFSVLFRFTVFSIALHSFMYLMFALNYCKMYYWILCVNFLCILSGIYCQMFGLNIMRVLIANIIIIMLFVSNGLLFTIDDNCVINFNRNEDMRILINRYLYTIFIEIENEMIKSIEYKIYIVPLLSDNDIKILNMVDKLQKQLEIDKNTTVSYAKLIDDKTLK